MSLVGPKYMRFEDEVHFNQCILFEIHKICKWKARSIINSAFGIPEDSFKMRDKELLLEIHQMLCKVCNYIDKVESPEYQRKMWERDFNNNVLADLATERLEQIRNDILDRRY